MRQRALRVPLRWIDLAKAQHVGLTQQDVHLHELAHVGRLTVGIWQGVFGLKGLSGEQQEAKQRGEGLRSVKHFVSFCRGVKDRDFVSSDTELILSGTNAV
jgi:hypothetical protein